MGYSAETTTQKENILFSLTDSGKLARSFIICIDTSKRILNILEIPPQTAIFADGFKGTLDLAYSTEVYEQIVSKAIGLKIDRSANADISTVSSAVNIVGGIELDLKNQVEINGHMLVRGKRTVTGSVAKLVASDANGYLTQDRYNLFSLLLYGFANSLKSGDTVTTISELLTVIANEIETDMNVSETVTLISKIDKTDKFNVYVLPMAKFNDKYYADINETLKILNENFVPKGFELNSSSLGLTTEE